MPTGVLMPVESMSMRVLIGIVQALVTPGNLDRRWFISRRRARRAASCPAPSHCGILGLEHDGRLEHDERRRIGGGLGAADLAEDVLDLGKRCG